MKKQNKTIVFGLHLMIDAYHCDQKILDDGNNVYRILNELPDLIGMHKLTLPYIVRADANDKKDPGGWSGFVMIQESHVSFHTFPKRQFASIDVYSCKKFDTKKTVKYFEKLLKTSDMEVYVQERGKKYPVRNT